MPSYTRRETLDDQAYILRELNQIKLGMATSDEDVMKKLRRIVPFERFAFTGLDIEGCQVGKGIYLASDLPEGFTKAYTEERFVSIDPLVQLVSPSTPTGQWAGIDSYLLKGSQAQRFCRALADHEIAPRAGITFWNGNGLYGGAVFTRCKPFTDDELDLLNLFAAPLHAQFSKPVIDAVNQRLGLMKGEILCLRLASEGLTSEEIARDTGYTFETVNTYLKSATKKLKASNRSHAVAEAIRRKIIN